MSVRFLQRALAILLVAFVLVALAAGADSAVTPISSDEAARVYGAATCYSYKLQTTCDSTCGESQQYKATAIVQTGGWEAAATKCKDKDSCTSLITNNAACGK